MGYLELLEQSASERGSIVCFGIDPVFEDMPKSFLAKDPEERIVSYFSQIIGASLSENRSIAALKPNYAYFAQYGFDGLRALRRLIDAYKGKIPIILDAKRGDIGKSSEAYAREAFEFWGADALTVSPYMGQDSLSPFLSRCKSGRGAYVLCRTSNAGAKDFQSAVLDTNRQLFIEVARKLERWHVEGMGAVMGATSPDEIEGVLWIFYDAKKRLPLLVPGVGSQGGSLSETVKVLRSVWLEAFCLHRINSSSAIAYAHKKEGAEDFVGPALSEISRMNAAIGKI
jgi:orotidine-5'-phosphate decarboxylase